MRSRPALSRSFSVSAFTIPSAILLLPRYPLPGERWCLLFSLPLFTSLSLSFCLSVLQSINSWFLNLSTCLTYSLSLSVSQHTLYTVECVALPVLQRCIRPPLSKVVPKRPILIPSVAGASVTAPAAESTLVSWNETDGMSLMLAGLLRNCNWRLSTFQKKINPE